MAKEILIVGTRLDLPDGSPVIGLNTMKQELRDEWREMNPNDLKLQFTGKTITVVGEDYQFETAIVGVEILNSIADFKNVFLKLKANANTRKIQLHDQVEVEL